MQNKFIFNTVKCFLYAGSLLIMISFSQIFSGCGGSDEEIVDKRETDSIAVYTSLQKAFTLYKKGLSQNESSDDKKASESFESSLKYLNEINYELITKGENYFWKQDYDEIAKSVVEDYFITQKEISQSSLVFDFAKRVPVMYEKIEHYKEDKEPLPDGSDVPLVRNSAVDEYIDFFSKTDRGRTFIDKCLYRSGKYFPIMRKILKFNNAPEELIYLSVQESGLNPTIVSRAGAVGLWQFMPATGYSYGLGQDGYRDDRRDFEKATDAAAHLLKDLYRTYDDWYLAFSAYNAGPGRVNSAIKKSGSNDFWTLRGYLPGETKNYVPSIIALSFVLRNPGEYGFNDVEYGNPVSFDVADVRTEMTLQRVAELCETDIETIRELNGEITNDIVPLYDVPYELRIPYKSFDKFAANFKKADDLDKSSNFPPVFAGNEASDFGSSVASTQYKVKNYEPADTRNIGSTTGKKRVTYDYKKKQLLSSVAVFFDVRPIEIRIWNNLAYGLLPKDDQKLNIYITEERYKILYGIKDEEPKKTEIAETETATTPISEAPVTGNKYTRVDNNNSSETSENNIPVKTTVPDDQSKDNSVVSTETPTEVANTETEYYEEAEPDKTELNNNNKNENKNKNEKVKEKTKEVTANKNKSLKSYTVKEGDNLTAIAEAMGVSLNDLMEWNDLETDKIIAGQKLKIQGTNAKTSVHIVSEGESLTMIAKEYGLSLAELKELNNIKDDKILVGQKLKVIETAETKNSGTTKTSGVKKTYKVKKGETLASISEDNDISLQDLISWNSLESDKILVGQVLKLYKEEKKTKIRKRKN